MTIYTVSLTLAIEAESLAQAALIGQAVAEVVSGGFTPGVVFARVEEEREESDDYLEQAMKSRQPADWSPPDEAEDDFWRRVAEIETGRPRPTGFLHYVARKYGPLAGADEPDV